MTYKLALVGIGKIANDQHIPALSDSDAFTLAATASRNGTVDGVTAYKSLAELLEAEPDIDCVSIATPPHVHYGDAKRAIEAGKHVMVEKPPGATLAEVIDLETRAKAAGVAFYTSWHSRHAAAVAAAKDWLADRPLESLKITWIEDVQEWHPGQDWVWEPGGLGVFDTGINALSILTRILPDEVHVKEAALKVPENKQTPIVVEIDFVHPEGAGVSAVFDWTRAGPPTWDMDIRAAGETAKLSGGGAKFEAGGEVLAEGEDREYPTLYAEFAELVAAAKVDADPRPLRHVADAFMLGRRELVEPFEWNET